MALIRLYLTEKKYVLKVMKQKFKYLTVSHITLAYSIPGSGTMKIKPFTYKDKHVSKKLFVDGKAVLLKGGEFDAEFSVEVRPRAPSSPPFESDKIPSKYGGKGEFEIKGEEKWISK